MPKIAIRISKDGSSVQMEAQEFTGPLCEDALRKMAEAFGPVNDEGTKPEYYAENTIGVSS